MNRVMLLIAMIAAIGTAGAIFAYPFVAEGIRGRVLYYGFCSLTLAVGMVMVLVADALERFHKRVRAIEQRQVKPGGRDTA